jgi:hypothetical protein
MTSYAASVLTYNQAKSANAEIVSDYFKDPYGQWLNYATPDLTQGADLVNQKHTDLRSFYPSSTVNGYISDLNAYSMNGTAPTLQGKTLSSINLLGSTTTAAESWVDETPYNFSCTAVSVSSNVATLTVSSGHGVEVNDEIIVNGLTTNTQFNGTFTVTAINTTSISYALIANDVTASETGTVTPSLIGFANSWKALKIRCTSTAKTVTSKSGFFDISSYETGSFISLAFPNLSSSLSLSDCSVEFTTDPSTSGFASNQTDKIYFNSNALLDNGTINREFKIPFSLLTNVFNNTNATRGIISGIRFTLKTSSGSATFYCSTVRCISPNWKYASVDLNTIDDAVMKTVPPTGAIPETTLATAITTTGSISSVVLADSSQFPSSGTILIGSEYISYTTNSSNTLGGIITRGALNTTPATHAVSDAVKSYEIKFSINHNTGLLPTVWPALFRSYNANGVMTDSDPKTLNHSVYTIIDFDQTLGQNSSSTNPNNVTFYFRNDGRLVNQTELNSFTQGNMNGKKITDLTLNDAYRTLQQRDLSVIPGVKASTVLGSSTYQANPIPSSNFNGLKQSVLSIAPGVQKNTSGVFGTYTELPPALTANIDNSTTTISVTNPGSLTSSGAIVVGSEIITYTSISSGALQGVVRGTNSSTPSAHRSGDYALQYTGSSIYQIGSTTGVGYKQSDFTATIDPNNSTYISSRLQWYKSSNDLKFKIQILDELSPIFSFDITSSIDYWKNKVIVFKTKLVDAKIQCELFELKNNELNLVYNTRYISSSFFHRLQGKFGWTTDLKDGGTRIKSIRSGGVIYGEYKSKSMSSFTPVRGAQVYANQTKDIELVDSIGSNKWSLTTKSVTSSLDSTDPKHPVMIYSVTNPASYTWQGIQTNKFKIESFEDIYATFDINMSSVANGIKCFLYDDVTNKILELNTPEFDRDQWSRVKLIVDNDKLLPGYYRLIVAQKEYDTGFSWKIKNISVKQRVINWNLRSVADGFWVNDSEDWMQNHYMNIATSNDFTKTTNINDGVLFAKAGTGLQVRAQAINPYIEIHDFEVHPSYATLGNFIWRDS